MELKSCTYATVTTLGDFGPWISKVVLDLPCTVRANDIDANTFHIYVERALCGLCQRLHRLSVQRGRP